MSENMELKSQALLERISNLTMQYENQIADLRVQLTVQDNQLKALQGEHRDAGFDGGDTVVEGEVLGK